MRILGYIEHPVYKITVFKMGNRITLKFENERFEQSFKLPETEHTSDLQKITAWVNEGFLAGVEAVFDQMHRNLAHALPKQDEDNQSTPLPVII